MNFIILLHKNGFGGIESYMSALYQELVRKGFNVRVYCHKSPNRGNLLFKNNNGGYLFFFIRLLLNRNNKVIFSNSLPLLLSLVLPVNKISLIHGIPIKHNWFYKLLFNYGKKFIFVNSFYLQEFVLNKFNVRVPIIYPMLRSEVVVDSINFLNNNLDSRIKHNLGYLGRVSSEKNLEKLILFHNNIASVYDYVKLYFKGKVEEDYKERLLRLSLYPDSVIFIDFSNNLSEFYEEICINFLITEMIESYGITTAEALLYNVKCVVPEYLNRDFNSFGNVYLWSDEYLKSIDKSVNFYRFIIDSYLHDSNILVRDRNLNSFNSFLYD